MTNTTPLTGRGQTATRVLSALAVVCLLVFIAPFAVYAVPQTVGADYGFVVLSGSMEPAISAGDVVVVERVPAMELGVGDVITFEKSGTDVPVTHRITEIAAADGQLSFTTKGDANEEADAAPVPETRVLGRVAYTIPYIGHVIVFVNTPLGFGALVVVPILLLLGLEVRDVLRDDTDVGASAATAAPDAGESSDAEAVAVEHVPPFTAADPVGVADDAAAAASAEPAADAPAGIAITPNDLSLTLGTLVLFAGYSGYVAYLLREVWAVTVFAAAVGLTVFAAALRVAAGRTVDAPESLPPVDDAGPSATDGGTEVER